MDWTSKGGREAEIFLRLAASAHAPLVASSVPPAATETTQTEAAGPDGTGAEAAGPDGARAEATGAEARGPQPTPSDAAAGRPEGIPHRAVGSSAETGRPSGAALLPAPEAAGSSPDSSAAEAISARPEPRPWPGPGGRPREGEVVVALCGVGEELEAVAPAVKVLLGPGGPRLRHGLLEVPLVPLQLGEVLLAPLPRRARPHGCVIPDLGCVTELQKMRRSPSLQILCLSSAQRRRTDANERGQFDKALLC